MNKAVFLDRDGTINVDKNYLYKIEDFEFLPGALEGLKLLQNAGYILIVITNQSGIARGFYTVEDYNKLTDYMVFELKKKGIILTDILYCPHHPKAAVAKYRLDCECRKPKLGLFYEATKKWDIDLSQSWAIGDKMRDCVISQKTLCKGIILEETEKQKDNLFSAKSLFDAAKIILKHS